jgi:predicted Zn finger-like uncharacterized protein
MAIRISCPSCDASLSFDDEKRGKKVRCKKCEEMFTLPGSNGKAKASAEAAAVQNGRKVKVKPAAATADDDDDDRPAKKKKKKPAPKKGNGVLLIVGGVAALLLLVVAGAAGLGAWLYFGKKPETTIAHTHEPPPEPEKKKEPEPAKTKEPEKKVEPEPKTGPPPLSPELQKVKDATVFVSATMPNQKRYEGTGFLAVEDGLVLSNASVLGMLDATAPPPLRIDVTLYPGEPNEATAATVISLGVDRDADLVALRVTAPVKLPTLPAYLMFEDSAKVMEAQPVHVASFPFEAKARKPFLITPTAIDTIKKAPLTGKHTEMKIGGGINRATSGGPVVTAAGAVVGISAGDDKTRLATPADLIRRFLDGSIGDATIGKVTKDSKVPVTYQISDPLRRVKEVRVEAWIGNAGPNRPYSYTPPPKLPGDGDRKAQPLLHLKASARVGSSASGPAVGDAVLPANVPTGQVVWLQPVITLKDNTMQWGIATTVTPPPTSPYDLKPANLTVKLTNPVDRTAKLDTTFSQTIKKNTTSAHITADIRENMGPDPDGAQMKTAYGNLTNADGQNVATGKPILDLVHQIPTTYTLDSFNKLTKRTPRAFDAKAPKDSSGPATTMQFQIGTAFEAGIVPMPNMTKQPADAWTTNYGIMMRSKGKTAEGNMALNLTYEGFLKRTTRNEAIITVTGKLQFPNSPDFKMFEGNVTGKIGFDEPGGYISSTQLKITNATDGSDRDSFTLDVDIQRNAGNSNIQLVMDTKPPDMPKPDGKPKNIVDVKGALTTASPFDPGLTDPNPKKKKIAYKQDIQSPVMMKQGKNYTIHVTAIGFQPYIRLTTPNGVIPQQSAGKLTYRATADTPFSVSVISHDGKIGTFHLTIQEAP